MRATTTSAETRRPGGFRAAAVSRSFAGVHALEDVTLELQRHEVVGLIGPNGAGKTTLVNVMTGFDRPTSGSVELDGEDVTRWSPHRRGAHGLARTFQHSHSFHALSVRENVEVAALGAGAGAARGPRAARRSCSSCSGCRVGRCPAPTLAHGDERRLGVARALATEPRYVLMDEPAAGLPEAEVPEFAAVVRSVRDDHDAGVLLIDHNMALIMEVCDRIQVLDQGRTLAEGTPDEIRANLDVAAAYLGESAVHEEADDLTPVLEVDELDVRYGGVAAVRGLSLEVGSGEIVGLIGPNGAGKSTTLHAIMGLVPAERGDDPARTDARCAAARPSASRASGVALVPEGRRIFAGLTVEENLRLGLAGAALARTAPTSDSRRSTSSSRSCASSGGGRRVCSRAASSSSSRSAARSSPSPTCCCSTSRRSGSRPKIVDVVFEALARDPRARASRPARRAARAADGRVRRPHVPDLERRAADCP